MESPPSSSEFPDPLLSEPEIVSPLPVSNGSEHGAEGDPQLPRKGRRAAVAFVFFTVTLDMVALGMIAPVLPRLIAGFLHGDAPNAARMLGLFGTVFAVMQFFCSPILGSLSDRFGRRPVMLLSNFGMAFDYLLMAWAPALGWLFLGRVISGVSASSIPTAMAYMADVTTKEKRAAAFGMLSAAFGVGFVLGPALGGILGNIDPRLPFWVAAGLSLINGMYGLFVLPESLSREHRRSFSWKRANPVGSFAMLRRSHLMIGMSAVLLLGYVAQQSLMNVYVIYADFRYHWSDRTVGISLAVVGIFTILYGGFVVKRVIAKFGERKSILIGFVGGAIGFCCFGLSKTGLLLWGGIPLMNLMSLAWPAAQSLMSRGTGPSEQGQLQGAINSLRGIAGLVGPGLFTYIFSKAIGPNPLLPLPGMPFFTAAALLLASLILAEWVTRRVHGSAHA